MAMKDNSQVLGTAVKEPQEKQDNKVNEKWIFRTLKTEITIDPATSKELPMASRTTSGRVDKPKRNRVIFIRRKLGPDSATVDNSIVVDGIREVDGNKFYPYENMWGVELAKFLYKKNDVVELLRGNKELLK